MGNLPCFFNFPPHPILQKILKLCLNKHILSFNHSVVSMYIAVKCVWLHLPNLTIQWQPNRFQMDTLHMSLPRAFQKSKLSLHWRLYGTPHRRVVQFCLNKVLVHESGKYSFCEYAYVPQRELLFLKSGTRDFFFFSIFIEFFKG